MGNLLYRNSVHVYELINILAIYKYSNLYFKKLGCLAQERFPPSHTTNVTNNIFMMEGMGDKVKAKIVLGMFVTDI